MAHAGHFSFGAWHAATTAEPPKQRSDEKESRLVAFDSAHAPAESLGETASALPAPLDPCGRRKSPALAPWSRSSAPHAVADGLADRAKRAKAGDARAE